MTISGERTEGKPADQGVTASDHATELRRDIAAATIVVALLLAGVAVGGSVAGRQEPLLAQEQPSLGEQELRAAQPAEASGSGLSLKFEYFPSNHVNQGIESVDEAPTF